jgi:hypothetical protein
MLFRGLTTELLTRKRVNESSPVKLCALSYHLCAALFCLYFSALILNKNRTPCLRATDPIFWPRAIISGDKVESETIPKHLFRLRSLCLLLLYNSSPLFLRHID